MIEIRNAKKADIENMSSIFAEVSLTDASKLKTRLRSYLSYVIKSENL